MSDRIRDVGGVPVPAFLYGTAWKEEATEPLVSEALRAGFRGIDTANQRKHYHEQGVGRALAEGFERGDVRRDEVFLQTKFTPLAGQDHRLPYDSDAPVDEQVAQSFQSSLSHLGVEQVDSYMLHGPTRRRGLGPADWSAWEAMESLVDTRGTKLIGVSNVGPDQLEELCQGARLRPAFVQNRCFARLGWDAPVRRVCERYGVVYQAFSLLTANPQVLVHPSVRAIAARHEKTVAQVVFRFALSAGMMPLTGTTDPQHMAQDLAVFDFELAVGELEAIARAGA